MSERHPHPRRALNENDSAPAARTEPERARATPQEARRLASERLDANEEQRVMMREMRSTLEMIERRLAEGPSDVRSPGSARG